MVKIQLERASSMRYRVLVDGKEIGVWKDPGCSAARYLIANGLAARDDILQTYRGDKLCMSGGVGWFADRTVREDDNCSPIFIKWRPFPVTRRPSGTASDDLEVL